jgi:hypothetical protein
MGCNSSKISSDFKIDDATAESVHEETKSIDDEKDTQITVIDYKLNQSYPKFIFIDCFRIHQDKCHDELLSCIIALKQYLYAAKSILTIDTDSNTAIPVANLVSDGSAYNYFDCNSTLQKMHDTFYVYSNYNLQLKYEDNTMMYNHFTMYNDTDTELCTIRNDVSGSMSTYSSVSNIPMLLPELLIFANIVKNKRKDDDTRATLISQCEKLQNYVNSLHKQTITSLFNNSISSN